MFENVSGSRAALALTTLFWHEPCSDERFVRNAANPR
jgi:hypothetical protein